MEKRCNLIMVNIRDLIKEKYEVPDFQRDYTWDWKNMQLVIDDINDARVKKKNKYILGPIVVKKKDGRKKLIDGQQRLTSLLIILKALGEEDYGFLTFENRDHVVRLFENIDVYDGENATCRKICQIYNQTKNYLSTIDRDEFKSYLLENVCFIEKTLQTDNIPHSFEVLNTVGEQLKNEDIAKAKLIAEISGLSNSDGNELMCDLLNYAWLLCYDNENAHGELYEKHTDNDICKAGDFSSLYEVMKEFIKDRGESVKTILKDVVGRVESGRNYSRVKSGRITDYQGGKYSVALTPYELLDVALSDKNSLGKTIAEIAGTSSGLTLDKETAFRVIKSLLLYRIAFDKYVVKRDKGVWNWFLSADIDKQYEGRFIKIESMLTVSGTEASKEMVRIIEKEMIKGGSFDASSAIDELEKYAVDRVKREVFDDKPVDGKDRLDNGTGTNHFVFHWLDYLLWLKRPEEIEDKVDKFEFKETTSVEHFMPQHPLGGENKEVLEEWKEELDSFGNLALITPSLNSRQNNSLPSEKAKLARAAGKDPESLKYELMMKIAIEKGKWTVQDSIDHGTKMKDLLKKSERIIKEQERL